MLSPLPRRSDWVSCMLIPPVVSAFPDRVVRSACASSFSRLARRSLALRPAHSRCHLFVTRITEGFNRFVTSTIAPVASGWSSCRVGLAPTGKRHLFTAHTHKGHREISTAVVQRIGGGSGLPVGAGHWISGLRSTSSRFSRAKPSDRRWRRAPSLATHPSAPDRRQPAFHQCSEMFRVRLNSWDRHCTDCSRPALQQRLCRS